MIRLAISHIRPPVPSRDYDYGAYIDGDEERGYLGFGSTPTEAVIDALSCEPDLFQENDWAVTVLARAGKAVV